jgi:hypothetical protein
VTRGGGGGAFNSGSNSSGGSGGGGGLTGGTGANGTANLGGGGGAFGGSGSGSGQGGSGSVHIRYPSSFGTLASIGPGLTSSTGTYTDGNGTWRWYSFTGGSDTITF